MSNNMLLYVIYGVGGIFAFIVIAFLVLNKQMGKSDYKKIQKLRKGTESNKFSSDIMYQKLYITYSRLPFIKNYILKLRRRLEILNVDDEYATRRDAAKILSKSLFITNKTLSTLSSKSIFILEQSLFVSIII